MNGIPRTKATNILHQWQTDSLAAASSSNQVLEGDDLTIDAATATTLLSNTCQISDKAPAVTGTQLAVVPAGRRDEMAYQIVKRSKELKRDMESSLLANNAEVATGAATIARELGGIESWLNTNTSVGAGGTAGSLGNTARTTGTDRDLTEALVKTQLVNIFDAGGDPDCIMTTPHVKTVFSSFTGNATRFVGAEDRELVASIEVYHSDFGDLEVIPNRFQVSDSTLILEKAMWAVAYLRPTSLVKISKTGDSEKRQIIAEYTLEARNEASSGAVFDVNNS